MLYAGYGFGGLFVLVVLFMFARELARPSRRGAPRLPPARVRKEGPPASDGEGDSPTWLLIVWGVVLSGLVAFFVALFYSLATLKFDSKGRVLRLRGRAALPARAEGPGWTDAALPSVQQLSSAERATLSRLWLLSARMEHASVAAFSQLSLHLAALGAPSELVERTHLAALDEIRHARRCYAIASAFAGCTLTAGPIAELAQPEATKLDAIRLAVGTLVDGCVAEGVAADVARAASTSARDPVVRDALAMIARDEETHAELAWSVLAWCLDLRGVRPAVARRVDALDQELAPTLPDLGGLSAERMAAHGLLDQAQIGQLAAARIAAVRQRASQLLAEPAAPARRAA